MKQAISFIWIPVIAFCFGSCQNGIGMANQHRAPIVLGDSSLIVTEKDSSFLSDNVADLEPQELVQTLPEPGSQAREKAKESTPLPSAGSPAPTPTNENGFIINFGHGVQVAFSGISTQSFQTQNPEKDAGVSYAVTNGNLSENKMTITGLKNVKVRQRYQSYLILQSGEEVLSLQNLGGYLSDWKELSASTGVISLSSLKDPGFKSVSHNTIRRAASRAAHSNRLSRQKTNFWLQKIKRTRSVKDEPCQVKLDNVQWQISGQTQDGHRLFKTIRLDAKK